MQLTHADTGYRPRPLQAQLHRILKRFNVLVCHRRFGKCLDIHTDIPTDNGVLKLHEIKKGMNVIASDGSLTEVIGDYEPFSAQAFDVHFDSGIIVRCDSEHLWYVEPKLSELSKNKRDPWVCGKTLTTKELVSGIEKGESYFIPTSSFDGKEMDLPIDPYWLGYWLGNGCKDYPSLYICNGDPINFNYTPTSVRQKKGCVNAYFGGNDLRDKLSELKVLGNKSIPEQYMLSSWTQRYQLLKGLMDSDGTVSSSGTCVFDNSDKKLAQQVCYLIRSLGFKAFFHTYRNSEYKILFSCGEKVPFDLPRKIKRVRTGHFKQIRHQIVDIVPVGKTMVRCIKVAAENSLFLCEDFIATHNTVFSINEMIDQGVRCGKKNPRYAYIAPLYSQAKRIAWDYLKDYTRSIPGATSNEQDLRVDIPFNGCRFSLFGADNPDSLRGIYLDGVILDEYSEMNPKIWTEILRPALADRKGWAIFIGTPKGRNSFYDMYMHAQEDEEWLAALYKASDTGVIEEEELRAAKKLMKKEEYEQEFECSFDSGLSGSFYNKLMQDAYDEGRVTRVPFDPSVGVSTAWDLGISDAMVIWFYQVVGPRIHIIDFMEETDRSLPWCARYLQTKSYGYDYHYLPHDAKARDLSTGITRERTMKDLVKQGRIDVVPKHYIEDGIHAATMILPKCYFDEKKCLRGIEHLKAYRKRFNAKTQMFEDRPLHDRHSHAADAFRILAMAQKRETQDDLSLPRTCDMDYNELGGPYSWLHR